MKTTDATVELGQILTSLFRSARFREAMGRRIFSGLRHEADDIIHDAVCDFLRRPPSSGTTVATALTFAVMRRASNRYRALAREKAALDDATTDAEAVEAPRPDEQYMRERDGAHLRERLDVALASLPANQSAALCMFAGDVPQEEIAACLGTTRGTVASWIKRARDALQPQLADLMAA